MKISKSIKVLISFIMAFMISPVPNIAVANSLQNQPVQKEMISTLAVLNELTRAEAEQELRSYLQKAEIKDELTKRGISSEEITSRLASLSEQEILQLSGQVKQAQSGGDILITILVVVLIIYIVRRI
jgi:hypothetical protein